MYNQLDYPFDSVMHYSDLALKASQDATIKEPAQKLGDSTGNFTTDACQDKEEPVTLPKNDDLQKKKPAPFMKRLTAKGPRY